MTMMREEVAQMHQFMKRTFAANLSESSESSSSSSDSSMPEDPLVNLIPLSVSVVDLDGLVQLVLDVSNNSWEGLRMSLGRLSPRK